MKLYERLKQEISHLVRREKGGSTVELAIVFPILLLFFVATAELGRLFYTYTTLAKATKTGARYMSTAANPTLAATQLKAQSLVVCGYETCTGNQPDGTAKKPIVDGLNMANPAANVNVTISQRTEGTAIVNYVTVTITGYSYPRGVFTLSGVTGAADSVIDRALTPSTTRRRM